MDSEKKTNLLNKETNAKDMDTLWKKNQHKLKLTQTKRFELFFPQMSIRVQRKEN